VQAAQDFCREVLTDERTKSHLRAHTVPWGARADERRGAALARALNARRFPYFALLQSAAAPRGQSQAPLTLLGARGGACSVAQLRETVDQVHSPALVRGHGFESALAEVDCVERYRSLHLFLPTAPTCAHALRRKRDVAELWVQALASAQRAAAGAAAQRDALAADRQMRQRQDAELEASKAADAQRRAAAAREAAEAEAAAEAERRAADEARCAGLVIANDMNAWARTGRACKPVQGWDT
jgi:hypothetical protein